MPTSLRLLFRTPYFGRIKQIILRNMNKSTKDTDSSASITKTPLGLDVLRTPIKSISDKKEYKVIRLPNGLTACLVSDITNLKATDFSDSESDYDTESESASESATSASEPEVADHDDSKMKKVPNSEEKMAAAALSIGVGCFSDPKDIPGLAHFLEHMVFMGSEKYPQENDFDSFIKKKGGSDNASTDCEVTTFYLECLEKHLFKSLDKFAQFFISPLMKKDSMTRERESIDSEFQIALPSDTYRKEQLLLSLFNKKVPINAFGWGNLKTLRDNIKDDILYERLHEFRKRHYSAHRMTLAIQARLPMATLESYVLDCFSRVPTNNLPADDFTNYNGIIFDSPEFRKIFYIEPVKEVMQVDITWPLPSLLHMYKSKPHQYVSWLLGHEGKGSLLSYLKKKVWALGIFSGNDESGSDHNSIYTLFTLTIILTSEGVAHLNEVIAAVYSYLQLLKKVGPQQRIFDEIQLVEETSFKFSEEEDPAEFVEELAECMQIYSPEYYLAGGELYFDYDPKAINMVMSHLNVHDMNIMVLTTTLPEGVKYDTVEPWFNINYTAQDIPKDWKEKWTNVPVYKDFFLPAPNPFLTNDFSLLSDVLNPPKHPEKILKTDMLELWYKKDNKFKFPIAHYNFCCITPVVNESPLSACMTDMYINLLAMQLTEDIYPAAAAELSYSISANDKGIVIKVNGYNEKLHILLDLIAKYFIKVSQNLTPELFNAVKDKLMYVYHNKFLNPSDLSKDIRLSILLKNYCTSVEKYTAMFGVTFNEMKTFSEKIVKSFYIQGLIQGNVSKETAINVSQQLVKTFKCEPLPLEKFPKMTVIELPSGEHCCRAMSFNKNDSNSIIVNYYQADVFSMKTNVILELLMMFIEEPLFDVLRTKEQLGYNVYCTVRDTFGILGYSITVNAQADKNTTHAVDSRIEAFVKRVNNMLKKLSEKKLNQIKRDLIKIKRVGDVDLEEEVGRHWSEIVNQDFMFDREDREVNAIEELTIKDIKKFWEEHNVFANKTKLKKLSVQVVGYNPEEKDKGSEQSENASIKLSPKLSRKSRSVGREISADKVKSKQLSHKEATLELVSTLDNTERKHDNYFIENIQEFKKKLNFYPDIKRNELIQ